VDESRAAIGFVSEPTLGSLGNLLRKYQNLPIPIPRNLDKFEFHEIEVG
jgi:hypothetical protein